MKTHGDRIEELKRALRPFAEAWDLYPNTPLDYPATEFSGLTYADLKEARRVLGDTIAHNRPQSYSTEVTGGKP